MSAHQQEVQTLDDIIFDNRNHEYGAYAIRRAYGTNVNKSVLIVFGFAVIIAGLSLIHPGADLMITSTPNYPLGFQPDITIIPIPQQPMRRSATTASRDLAPRVTTKPEEPLIEQPLQDPSDGVGDLNLTGETADLSSGSIGVEVSVAVATAPEVPLIYDHTQIMPTYKGGMEAMSKFLHKHIKYPAVDRRIETQGTVYVSFILGANGQVMDAVVVKGISKGCDNEALRVITMMPSWNPGIQGGIPVMVRMVLPIRFQLN
ncbi:MAG TPA: energy transducer TonB [Chryseolinea sp.]|nr:energy transducer TonB [Chryseolinea sp.]